MPPTTVQQDPPTLEATRAGPVPLWFAPALAAALAPLTRTAHITYYLQCGDGRDRSFKVVPFVNGDDPTDEHNLPPLRSVDDIDGLTGPQTTAYLEGYNAQLAPNIDQKLAICIAIGCGVL